MSAAIVHIFQKEKDFLLNFNCKINLTALCKHGDENILVRRLRNNAARALLEVMDIVWIVVARVVAVDANRFSDQLFSHVKTSVPEMQAT